MAVKVAYDDGDSAAQVKVFAEDGDVVLSVLWG